jgi:hypothetical protein
MSGITMNASPATHSPPVPTAPVFTLGSALRWLGHDCPDHRWSQSIDALPASMWFLRRGHPLPTHPLEAVLVVDFTETGEPLARIQRLIDEVNRCTRGETIRVRQRHSSDNGHDLIAPAGGREQNVGGLEIAVPDTGVLSRRDGPQHVSQDRTHRHLRRLPMVH